MTTFKAACVAAGFLLVVVLPFHAHAKEGTHTILKSLSPPWGSVVSFIPPQQISKDKTLVASGSTLYLLNHRRETLWKFDARADINGFAYVPRLHTIYIIAMDLTWVAIDAKSGEKRWSLGANGRATYSEIAPVGKDKYVVVTDMSGYDREFSTCEEKRSDGEKVTCKREEPDVVEVMKDQTILGRADFPPHARLAVFGEEVWAVITGSDSVTLKRIKFKKPQ